MAGRALKRFARQLDYTATWAAGVLTVTTVTPHFLKTGDIVHLYLTEVTDEANNLAVTVIDTVTFTVPKIEYQFLTSSGKVIMEYYSAGQTGAQETFSITPSGQNQGSLFQFTAHGAGGATIALEVSNDRAGWITLGSVTLPTNDLATDFLVNANNWVYGRVNITSIGAATTVVLTSAT